MTWKPVSARIWPVFFHECLFWPPPCSIRTVGRPSAEAASRFHSSPIRLRSSTPRNVTVCDVLCTVLTWILSAFPLHVTQAVCLFVTGPVLALGTPPDEFPSSAESTSHAQHHSLPLVRRQPRRSRRLLRVGLSEFVRRTVLPLHRGRSWYPRRRAVRHLRPGRAPVPRHQRWSAVSVHRGGVVRSALRRPGRSRLLLVQARRRRRGVAVWLAQGSLRIELANRARAAVRTAGGPRPGTGRRCDHGDARHAQDRGRRSRGRGEHPLTRVDTRMIAHFVPVCW